jgi:hypothetical protein
MLRCLRNRARLRSVMSAFVGKADMMRTCFDVRFWPKADIRVALGNVRFRG